MGSIARMMRDRGFPMVRVDMPGAREGVTSHIDIGFLVRNDPGSNFMVVRTCVDARKDNWEEVKVYRKTSRVQLIRK